MFIFGSCQQADVVHELPCATTSSVAHRGDSPDPKECEDCSYGEAQYRFGQLRRQGKGPRLFTEVEGNNQSVQDALKTMVSAMSRPVRIISDEKANGKPAALLAQVFDEDELDQTAERTEPEVEHEESEAATRRARGTGEKKDRNAGLTLVPNLNFRPSGKDNWKDFLVAKNASNDVEVTVAAVYYMSKMMGIEKVSASHVMTAFKEAVKAVPADLRATIRNIKRSKIWLNFADLDDIHTTTQGDNYVEHEMGKGNSS